jgi:DMSO/TMAO reductase YedYZ molybdopterin-dependent catalytic subunit
VSCSARAGGQTVDLPRRRIVSGVLAAGGLATAAATVLSGHRSGEAVLSAFSLLNDRAQAALFSPARRAPTYDAHQVTVPFPFNAFYPESLAPHVDARSWRLEFGGRIGRREPWSLERLLAQPHETQVTRLICIEGWSAVGQWSGVPLRDFLQSVGADLAGGYVGFECADGYRTAIDMPSALHPQTILATQFLGRPLPQPYGFPLRLRIPTKLGFKNAKFITALYVTDKDPGGTWEDQGYNRFAGL